MLTYLLRRLLLIPPTLIGMTAIVFAVMANAPGGVGANLISRTGEMKPAERKAREEYLNQRYGLDKPKPIQYLRWLNRISPIRFASRTAEDPKVIEAKAASEAAPKNKDGKAPKPKTRAGDLDLGKLNVALPDLGTSWVRQRPVTALIGEALPRSMLLQAIALPIGYTLAVWLGINQAKRRGSVFDYGMSASTLALWSVPSIWVGVLLIGFLANDQYLHWFPTSGLSDISAANMRFLPWKDATGWNEGWLLDRFYHMVLPTVCLVYGNFAFLSRLTRGALLDNLYADFVRTARAKGLPERFVLYRHAFRNSLIPLITVAAYILPSMIAGSVVVESIFTINGMGKLAVEAATQRDMELLLSITMVAGFLQLTGYLLTDIGYAIADPRVSYA
ncbi:MAG TPA: ABC transporter permease [Tepidisphaeraceae bacterium]|nr:ABC transporter permease [Tepidisphaeraceae bacterium]